jgi:beta-lactamase regulating signal transducer with metallopeptidase domain
MNEHLAIRTVLALGDLAAKSALVLSVAWLMTLALRKAPAAVRHLTWVAAFGMLLSLPILSVFVPALPLTVLREPSPVTSTAAKGSGVELTAGKTDAPLQSKPDATALTGSAQETPESKSPITAPQKRTGFATIAPTALSLWLIGVLALAAQCLRGYLALWKLKARPATSTDLGSIDLETMSRRVGLRRSWQLRMSEGDQPPAAMTWGSVRPIVLLPKNSDSWSQERLEAVLLHELAHVRRFDCASQLLAIVSSALYWFNPAVWLCARAMRAEAEAAADDTVIRLGVKPSDYARELLRIAADVGHRRQLFTNIGVPVMKQPKIESRVKAILDPSARRRRGVTLFEAMATVIASAAIAIPLCAVRTAAASPPVPAEPGDELIAQLHTKRLIPQASVTSAASLALAARLARTQAQQTESQANLRHVQALKKALQEKSMQPAANLKRADEKKLAAELKELQAEEGEMRTQLARAKVQLAQVRAQLIAAANQSAARSAIDAQGRRVQQRMMEMQAQLLRQASEQKLKSAQLERQRANMDREGAEIKRRMEAAVSQLQRARQEAIEQAEKTKAETDRTKNPDFELRFKKLSSAVELAQRKATMQRQNFDRVKALVSQGATPSSDLSAAEYELKQAQVELSLAKARLMAELASKQQKSSQ